MATHDIGIGKLITTENPQRDAIHIAVAPVISDDKLFPGQPVSLKPGTKDKVVASLTNPLGIVDPFLVGPLYPGQRFYIFLYPNTVTSLRHEWTHPAFDPHKPSTVSLKAFEVDNPYFEEERKESEQWLIDFAEEHNISYEKLLDEVDAGEVCFGRESGPQVMRNEYTKKEFWHHYQKVTGKRMAEEKQDAVYFVCGC